MYASTYQHWPVYVNIRNVNSLRKLAKSDLA